MSTQTAPRPPRTRRRASEGGEHASLISRPRFLTYGLLLAFVLGSVFPLWWSFIVASHESSVVRERIPPLLPGANFFSHAAEVFDTVPFWLALGNSLIVATTVTVSVVLFGTLAGYAFARLRFRGSGALFAFVVATLAVPTQLGIIPLYIAMTSYGWQGQLAAVIVPNLVTAFGVFWMRQYLVGALPHELLEAARVDGCSMIRTFWHVVLPIARPAAAILGLFTFMHSWNDFLWPLVVLDAQNPTVQVALERLQAGYYTNYSLVLAGTTLATIPILLVFVIFGKQIVANIAQGAVKG
ncbi:MULTISPECIES: carbohydrate ABC transporter permease [Actinoalloteichus]|uniref:Cellobiose ABC transporter membrane protein n=1 Tax=Actinoalloteichus caeruleus DSM 43889 TaxID=1120930 RepID=A0ABT1JNH1_ACTCY|nr:carbohydrate ABC transporter permease [Actinoalloteichus caeruleus]MCP2334073.1 cellobiose ABC transporter membrane protein [Actinoalloteichus caeruleus DSM 43889]